MLFHKALPVNTMYRMNVCLNINDAFKQFEIIAPANIYSQK